MATQNESSKVDDRGKRPKLANPHSAKPSAIVTGNAHIKTLCDEIEVEIKRYENSTFIDHEFLAMSEKASNHGDYALNLFRRLSGALALQRAAQESVEVDVNFMKELPPIIYEGTSGHFGGKEALSRNIFWLRALLFLFYFVSFCVMVSVPLIHQVHVNSKDLVHGHCDKYAQQGQFNFGSYQAVLGIACVGWIYSLAMCSLYLFPVNTNGTKRIPYTTIQIPYIHIYGKLGELVFDSLLLICCVFIACFAASNVDSPSTFVNDEAMEIIRICLINTCEGGYCSNREGECEQCDYRCENGRCPGPDGDCPEGEEVDQVQYEHKAPHKTDYSLRTFSATYGRKDCLNGFSVDTVQASISLLFVAIVLLCLTLQISLRSWLMQRYQEKRSEIGESASKTAVNGKALPVKYRSGVKSSASSWLQNKLPGNNKKEGRAGDIDRVPLQLDYSDHSTARSEDEAATTGDGSSRKQQSSSSSSDGAKQLLV